VWLSDDEGLVWVDSLRGLVRRLSDGVHTDLGEKVGSVAPAGDGGFVVALEHRVVTVDGNGRLVRQLCALDLPATHRLNDGAVDPFGRFVFGSMNERRDQPNAALYRLCANGVEVLRRGLTLSNGVDWAPDGRTIYFTDSVAKRIFMADYPARGGLRDERVFAQWSGPGMPDGLAVDGDGHVWAAIWDDACLVRFTPDGRLAERIDLPVPRPTSLAFGGPGLRTIYVTSARVGLSQRVLHRSPLSGAVLTLAGSVSGQVARRVTDVPPASEVVRW